MTITRMQLIAPSHALLGLHLGEWLPSESSHAGVGFAPAARTSYRANGGRDVDMWEIKLIESNMKPLTKIY